MSFISNTFGLLHLRNNKKNLKNELIKHEMLCKNYNNNFLLKNCLEQSSDFHKNTINVLINIFFENNIDYNIVKKKFNKKYTDTIFQHYKEIYDNTQILFSNVKLQIDKINELVCMNKQFHTNKINIINEQLIVIQNRINYLK